MQRKKETEFGGGARLWFMGAGNPVECGLFSGRDALVYHLELWGRYVCAERTYAAGSSKNQNAEHARAEGSAWVSVHL